VVFVAAGIAEATIAEAAAADARGLSMSDSTSSYGSDVYETGHSPPPNRDYILQTAAQYAKSPIC
jgi:hypothetical protein